MNCQASLGKGVGGYAARLDLFLPPALVKSAGVGAVRCLVALCARLCMVRMAMLCVCVLGACWAVRVAYGFHATRTACPNARWNLVHVSNV